MKFILLLALIGALFYALRQFLRPQEAAPVPLKPRPDLASLTITDARVGDTLSLSGAGENFADLDLTIDRQGQYESGQRQWTDLSGMYRGRRVYLEVKNESQVEVLVTTDPRELTLDQLGLSEEDLVEIDKRQNPNDFIEFDGKVWHYRFSKEIGYFQSGQPQGAGFYCWEFAEDGGERLLDVEKWEGEPFTGWISRRVNPGDITVYRGT